MRNFTNKQSEKWIFMNENRYRETEVSKFSDSEDSETENNWYLTKRESEVLPSYIPLYTKFETKNQNEDIITSTSPHFLISQFEDSPFILRFIEEMNKNAKDLQMSNTHFDSPHGLANKNNKSTAYDMAKLWMHCVKI